MAPPPYERVELGIGCVLQGRWIFNPLTVDGNLRMGLATRPAGIPVPAERFETFPVLEPLPHRRGGELCGGRPQPAIARARRRAEAAGARRNDRRQPAASSRASVPSCAGWPSAACTARAAGRWRWCRWSRTTTSPPSGPTGTGSGRAARS
jgi:hypothetical protein